MMVVELLCNLLKLFLLFIISLFPELPDMQALSNSVSAVSDVLISVNSFISVRLVGGCGLALFLFTNADFVWSIIMWVVKKIPGVS